jgi:hypothetical protein
MTHLPLAPNVELTAFVSFSIPLNTLTLALSPKLRFLTILSDMIKSISSMKPVGNIEVMLKIKINLSK